MTSPGRFFEREELGWDKHAPLDALREVGSALLKTAGLVFGESAGSALVGASLLSMLFALVTVLAIVDRRLVRASASGEISLPLAPQLVPLLVPGGIAATLFISERLLGTSALAATFATFALLFTVARLLTVPGSLLSDSVSANRLKRQLVYPGRLVLGLSALVVGARAVGAAAAVVDLFTLTRNLALMLSVVALLPVRRDLMAVFPETGNPRYVAVRRQAGRMLAALLASSLVLLLLWNLGFRRAAETLLLRSYAVLAVVLAGALASRWMAERDEAPETRRHPVLEVVVGPADWVLRLVVYGLLGWALLASLGLWVPLTNILAQPFLWVGSGGVSVLSLAKGAVVVVAAAYISRTIRAAMEVWWFPALEVPAATRDAVSTAAHYLTMLIAGAGALTLTGVDLRGLAVFAGAAGLGIGLGLREVASQTISGMTLLFAGTLGKGDSVTLPSGQFGRVREIGLRRTLFETPDGSEISVPSSDLVNGQITVWTRRSPYVRVRAEVTLPADAEAAAVMHALRHAGGLVQRDESGQALKVWMKSALPAGVECEVLAWVDITGTSPEEASARLLQETLASLQTAEIRLARPFLAVAQS